MNVRHMSILPLLFLLILLVPTMVNAEKGGNKSEENGKAAPKNVVIPEVNSAKNPAKGKVESLPKENARVENQQATKVQKPEVPLPQKKKQPEQKSQTSKELPTQANKKANEAQLRKTEKKQEKRKNPNPISPIHKEDESKKPSVLVKMEVNPTLESKIRDDQGQKISKSSSHDTKGNSYSNFERTDNASSVDRKNSPWEDLPVQFPRSEPTEFFISQNNSAGISNAKGSSADSKVSSKSMIDLLTGSLEEIRMNFLQPYVMRQHIYRNQWVNAPPAPPPESALFSNNI